MIIFTVNPALCRTKSTLVFATGMQSQNLRGNLTYRAAPGFKRIAQLGEEGKLIGERDMFENIDTKDNVIAVSRVAKNAAVSETGTWLTGKPRR
jgi:hypothetical protein